MNHKISYLTTPLLALGLLWMTSPAYAQMAGIDAPSLMEIYRDLHAHPELGFEETRSAGILSREFTRLGFEVTTKVGKTGVVAVMRNGDGPVLMLRADMDGLPVAEQTGLAFASKATGQTPEAKSTYVMHACGHDTHMTTLIGVARDLAGRKKEWSGTLILIGQPAEELGLGAKAMLEDGLYERLPKPDYALAFHNSASLLAGVIGVKPGYALANVDTVDVVVKGVGGHGAYPHTTKDPIVLAARIVTSLQTLVSREINPQESAVVTVGSFHAGTKHNIVPDEARLQLTVRSYSEETRAHLLSGIARIAKGEAIAAGMPEAKMPVVTTADHFTPATFNTEAFASRLQQLWTGRFGTKRVVQAPATMGGEDFGRYYLADKSIQSTIFWVGGVSQTVWDEAGGDPARLPSLHSPLWAPQADVVISTANEAMTMAALDIMAIASSD